MSKSYKLVIQLLTVVAVLLLLCCRTHFRPKTPPKDKTEIEEPSDLFSNNVLSLQVEDMLDTSNDQLTTVSKCS